MSDHTLLNIKLFFNGLENTDKQIAFLFYYEELTPAEIANVLEIPVEKVNTRMRQIRKELEVYMQKLYFDMNSENL